MISWFVFAILVRRCHLVLMNKLPVKPVVEFDMVDKRFIEQGDVLSGIDSRPNLMDLTSANLKI